MKKIKSYDDSRIHCSEKKNNIKGDGVIFLLKGQPQELTVTL